MQLQPWRFHVFIFRTVLGLLSPGRSPFSLGQESLKCCMGAAQDLRGNSLQVEYSCSKEIARIVMRVPGTSISYISFCVYIASDSWARHFFNNFLPCSWSFLTQRGFAFSSVLHVLVIDSLFTAWISLLVILEPFLNSLCRGLLSLPVYLWRWLLHWHHLCLRWRETVPWWIGWNFLPEL